MSRREFLAAAAGGALLLPQAPEAAAALLRRVAHRDSVVIEWNDALLAAVRESKLGPPMVARALAVAHTCMYDAWAAYDRVALGTRLGGLRVRPPQRTLANKRAAISHAAYLAAVDLFPGSRETVFRSTHDATRIRPERQVDGCLDRGRDRKSRRTRRARVSPP
jgi:hypothetical protein